MRLTLALVLVTSAAYFMASQLTPTDMHTTVDVKLEVARDLDGYLAATDGTFVDIGDEWWTEHSKWELPDHLFNDLGPMTKTTTQAKLQIELPIERQHGL